MVKELSFSKMAEDAEGFLRRFEKCCGRRRHGMACSGQFVKIHTLELPLTSCPITTQVEGRRLPSSDFGQLSQLEQMLLRKMYSGLQTAVPYITDRVMKPL